MAILYLNLTVCGTLLVSAIQTSQVPKRYAGTAQSHQILFTKDSK